MSLHKDLLKQASLLARKEPKKPLQASLRRAVSASYDTIFHLLVDEATRLMLKGHDRAPLRDNLARAFHHATMKQTAVAFTKGTLPPKLVIGANNQVLQRPLIAVAETFVQLQEARHAADYDRSLRFTRQEVLDLIDLTEQAFQDWKQIHNSLQADTFLIGLLTYRHMQG
ncbi:MAG: hypothetical protein OXC53_09050 [Rhodobacteraceae bacterium]|nr:hypothetical protein [Paracoccaceae bacterium]